MMKKFQQYKKSGQKSAVMFALQVKSESNEIFHQIRKRHVHIQFDVKSKRLKLQNRDCARFVENLKQIPKPTLFFSLSH